MNKIVTINLFVLSVMIIAVTETAASEVKVHKNENSGLLTWTVKDDGFQIELLQLLPDFIRAIYAKHDFPEDEIERAASYCIFGTILKNTSDQQMSYRVADWRYQTSDGKQYPVKTKTQWLEEWRNAGVTFSWTLLPDEGEFSVGDWQQGFTTVQLPRNTEFDMIFKWQLDGVEHTGILENIKCAPESLPEK
ncbi:MAG: hypothetical protein OQK93_04870 [Gammaproteobacteria bacterium]|nr:hypothetical protein [Gammaproteobacteria bacterium]